jgi:hypothetical protein
MVLCVAAAAQGQARIDPSLPSAPLSHVRVLCIFPGFETVGNPDINVPPLTAREKWQIFLGRSFDPSMPVEAAMFSSLAQAINYSPHYGTGGGAYAERFGAYAGSIVSASFFTDFALPVVLHQDPRYFRKGSGSVPSRIWYAVTREVVGHRDDGTSTLNTSGLLGFGLSTATSNIYYPRNSITFSSNMQRYGVKLAVSAALNIMREFGATGPPIPNR